MKRFNESKYITIKCVKNLSSQLKTNWSSNYLMFKHFMYRILNFNLFITKKIKDLVWSS